MTREDFCILANIEDATEEAWRKRGKAPPYVVIGRSILYPTKGVAEHLLTIVRSQRSNPVGGML